MQATVNTSKLIPAVNQLNVEDTYMIKIEMIDGSSQFVNLSMDQVMALGLQNIGAQCKEQPPKKPTSMFNYKIIQPSDLNLRAKGKPVNGKVEASVPRGRPRKRPSEVPVKVDAVEEKPVKIAKTSRTRYGRITKPPTHMEKDYEKIVTNIKPNLEHIKELDTVQFEPMKTANTNKEQPPLLSLNLAPKKKNIPAQYKCPSCKKVYMGRNIMARHFHKYPDHRTASEVVMPDCNTWYFLIETALRSNKGRRGEKFCKELMNLVRNARVMAKNFLKKTSADNSEYVVDSILAEILNIQEGNYRFVETSICKDVNIFSFLLDDAFLDTHGSDKNAQSSARFEHVPLHKTSQPAENFVFDDVSLASEEIISVPQIKSDPVIDLHFGSDITDVINIQKSPKKELFAFENTSTPVKCRESKTLDSELNKNDFMHIFSEDFIDKAAFVANDETDISHSVKENMFTSNLFLNKEDVKTLEDTRHHGRNGKEVDIFRNTIPNILNFGASDEHMSTLMDKEKKIRKGDEFDLNKLHLVEFLPDAPVNSILDTSTGSDDIMNVDQFVNERFKNLTEPEGDLQNIQNATLNLDLPVLECFNFHS